VTPDELPPGPAPDLAMRASVNGRPYSAGRLGDLYWHFGQLLAYASRGTRLVSGDVIGSGTVGTGCILELSRVHGAEAYPWLSAGDRVRLEVDGSARSRAASWRARPPRTGPDPPPPPLSRHHSAAAHPAAHSGHAHVPRPVPRAATKIGGIGT
jgi:2-keto-4-pentenoate hydratase/2-oxohepta-3-ene-1,7-dioic acid hydratase (catechol pathway)